MKMETIEETININILKSGVYKSVLKIDKEKNKLLSIEIEEKNITPLFNNTVFSYYVTNHYIINSNSLKDVIYKLSCLREIIDFILNRLKKLDS